MQQKLFALCERVRALERDLSSLLEPVEGLHETAGDVDLGKIMDAARNPRFTVALLGGTRVGKSTLLDALVGQEISRIGDTSCTTKNVVAYAPELMDEPSVRRALNLSESDDKVIVHDRKDFGRFVLLDTPDFDGWYTDNRERLLRLLPSVHVFIAVVTQDKYKDAAVLRLLRQLAAQRGATAFAVVLNKTDLPVNLDPIESLFGEAAEPTTPAASDVDTWEQVRIDVIREMERVGIGSAPLFCLSAEKALRSRGEGEATQAGWWRGFMALETYLGTQFDAVRQDAIKAAGIERQLRAKLVFSENKYRLSAKAVTRCSAGFGAAEEGLNRSVADACAATAHEAADALRALYARCVSRQTYGPAALYLRIWANVASGWTGVVPAPIRRWLGGGAEEVTSATIAATLHTQVVTAVDQYWKCRRAAVATLVETVVPVSSVLHELAGKDRASPAEQQLELLARECVDRTAPVGLGQVAVHVVSLPTWGLRYVTLLLALWGGWVVAADSLRTGGFLVASAEVAGILSCFGMTILTGFAILEVQREVLAVSAHRYSQQVRTQLAGFLEANLLALLAPIRNSPALVKLQRITSELADIRADLGQSPR